MTKEEIDKTMNKTLSFWDKFNKELYIKILKQKNMKTLIEVNAKLWFNPENGNTYHAAQINIHEDNKPLLTFESGMKYGYDDHYKITAGKLLNKETLLLKGLKTKSDCLSDLQLIEELEENGVKVIFHTEDVQRERELKF